MGRAAASEDDLLACERRLLIGVDIDGVIGDAMSAIAPLIRDRFGIDFDPEAVDRYDYHLSDDVHIGHVLSEAMTDDRFVTSYPLYQGAKAMLDGLRSLGHVTIVTARPDRCGPATKEWLQANSIAFDAFMIGSEGAKSESGVQILIDDYIGNVHEFVEQTDGAAVLVERRYNHDRSALAAFGPRVEVATSLEEVPALVARLAGRLGG